MTRPRFALHLSPFPSHQLLVLFMVHFIYTQEWPSSDPGVRKGRVIVQPWSSLGIYSRMCQQSTSGKNPSHRKITRERERSTFKPGQAAAASLWAQLSWNFGYAAGRHVLPNSSCTTEHTAHTKWHSLPRFLNRTTWTQPDRTPRVINWHRRWRSKSAHS